MSEESAITVQRPNDPPDPYKGRKDAIDALTMQAYARASQLVLTPEEISAMQADFPDDAFRKGAAGKEALIYIEHAFLRDRLNEVFGPGQWAIIPRSRWTDEFTTGKGTPGVKVYVEAMLLIRGCFVAEAVGDMDYWPKNESTNYGDAVEGAKTAALRRCVKEIGIGLQAWKKAWCEGWWKRNPTGRALPQENTATISEETILWIEKALADSGADRQRFLKVAGVKDIAQITQAKWPNLRDMLNRKLKEANQ